MLTPGHLDTKATKAIEDNMYTTALLADGTHFRFHGRDGAGLRVSFDQTDREQVWGVMPRPPAGYTGTTAQWIADYSASGDTRKEVVSTHQS